MLWVEQWDNIPYLAAGEAAGNRKARAPAGCRTIDVSSLETVIEPLQKDKWES